MTWGKRYKRGDFLRIDDRSGFRVLASKTRQEWTGRIVDEKLWESRQPQDFVKGVRDQQAVPQPRPRQQPAVFPGTQPSWFVYNDPNMGSSFIVENPFGPGPYGAPSFGGAYLEILRGNGIANTVFPIPPPPPPSDIPIITDAVFTVVLPITLPNQQIGTVFSTNVNSTAIWEILNGDTGNNFKITTDAFGFGILSINGTSVPVAGDYTFLIQVTNADALSDTGTVTVHVQPDTTPVVTDFIGSFTLPVLTVPTTLTTMFASNGPNTWHITNGNNLGYFSIDLNTGDLKIASAAIVEGTYMLTISATNSFPRTGFGTATITIEPEPPPPPPDDDDRLMASQYVPILG